MASACINNSIGVPPEKFPSYGWLSPRISFSREEDTMKKPSSSSTATVAEESAEISDPVDFEFRLEDPVAMLPADELFSDGKLVPLHVSTIKPSTVTMKSPEEANKACDISSFDPYLFSPKAPRCSSRWKELLGLKRLYNSHNSSKSEPNKATNSKSSSCSVSSSSDGSLNLPLLKDSDCESVSISSSRLSLSSSSSGHEHEDLPRLSLDSDKPNLNPNPNPFANPPRMRMVKPRDGSNHHHNHTARARAGRSPMRRESAPSRGVSVDSPRMNSSGKIVFQSLERSSSSPSSFNGGPRFKHRGMERSYSANVRVTPVLNVPVCSLRGSSKSGSVFGFGQLFSSPQKNGNGPTRQQQQSNSRNRTDRT
ncbi:Serine/arginine repetitive matrix-like protein [Melia azedarach]|uniref:Serine/arginine repetitive matrix-like protein n=1 Tax=Melia azedarach TaxID=155640 RepID=A0ACC1YTR3_MELAZ|nr:Serine/arginine repetitive matrix-like protein [Melia azedarach]